MIKEGNKINGVKIYDYIYEITEGVLKALEKKHNIQITDKKFTKELRDNFALADYNEDPMDWGTYEKKIKNMKSIDNPVFDGGIYAEKLNKTIREFLRTNRKNTLVRWRKFLRAKARGPTGPFFNWKNFHFSKTAVSEIIN